MTNTTPTARSTCPSCGHSTTTKAPRRKKATQEPMTYHDAAAAVLAGSSTPLTLREITDRAIEAGLIVSNGATPTQTMASILYADRTGAFVKIKAPGGRRNGVRWRLSRRQARQTGVASHGLRVNS